MARTVQTIPRVWIVGHTFGFRDEPPRTVAVFDDERLANDCKDRQNAIRSDTNERYIVESYELRSTYHGVA